MQLQLLRLKATIREGKALHHPLSVGNEWKMKMRLLQNISN